MTLEGFYTEQQMMELGRYKTLRSFRSALYDGRVPVKYMTFGRSKFFSKEAVHDWLASGTKIVPSQSRFQSAKSRLSSLKTECTEPAKPHIKEVG